MPRSTRENAGLEGEIVVGGRYASRIEASIGDIALHWLLARETRPLFALCLRCLVLAAVIAAAWKINLAVRVFRCVSPED